MRPSAAQLRVHGVLIRHAEMLLREVPIICGDAEIQQILRFAQIYGDGGHSDRLDCGVVYLPQRPMLISQKRCGIIFQELLARWKSLLSSCWPTQIGQLIFQRV
eukprot:6199405-Karenia_brevis.AAC.1